LYVERNILHTNAEVLNESKARSFKVCVVDLPGVYWLLWH